MYWFKHSCTASAEPPVSRVLHDFGFAGVGMVWTLVEHICYNRGSFRIDAAKAMFLGRHFSYARFRRLICDYDLFLVDEVSGVISLREGLVYSEPARTPSVRPASAPGSPPMAAGNVPACEEVDVEIEKDTVTKAADSAEPTTMMPDEERAFYTMMQRDYPTLLRMQKPLTLDQLVTLRTKYPAEEVADVMSAMENYPRLLSEKKWASKTIEGWIKARRNRRRCNK